ncbi:MAG: hypothetical protein ACKVQV_03685 [Bacteroidia bacterium]
MKNINFNQLRTPARLFYHFFAITGMVGSLLFAISWSGEKAIDNSIVSSSIGTNPDVNVAPASAKGFVDAFQLRYAKEGSPSLPKGYFISKAALDWVLQDESNNGVYVYPAINASGAVCVVVEPGSSANASYRPTEGIAGRVVMSESPCPTDCGSLMR